MTSFLTRITVDTFQHVVCFLSLEAKECLTRLCPAIRPMLGPARGALDKQVGYLDVVSASVLVPVACWDCLAGEGGDRRDCCPARGTAVDTGQQVRRRMLITHGSMQRRLAKAGREAHAENRWSGRSTSEGISGMCY